MAKYRVTLQQLVHKGKAAARKLAHGPKHIGLAGHPHL